MDPINSQLAQLPSTTALQSETSQSITNAGSQSAAASATLGADFETFLTLLTTQLQNQDPLEPLDTEQFTQQLVQFAGVEQSIATNENLETLIALQSSNQNADAFALIGKSVSFSANEAVFDGQSINWEYTLRSPSQSVQVEILDESQNVVATLPGPGSVGANTVTWSGIGDNGETLAAGRYSARVTQTDPDGSAQSVATRLSAEVLGILLNDGTPTLETDHGNISLDDIFRVGGNS
ncbi:MAG: flagellar hook capping FlgD N-terminal domain-containing protein [Pseudomonadota bacterium]